MNPIIPSPGTGVQQRASFTNTSPTPSTSIALLERLMECEPVGITSIVGSGCESSTPSETTNFSMIDAAETWPSPTAL